MLYLSQSDTTAGFLSLEEKEINSAKERGRKKVLLEVDSLHTLKNFVRVPQKHKNRVRRAQKSTFIYPNLKACRVVKDKWHLRFLHSFAWMYSSSANPSGERFCLDFAIQKAQVIIQDKRGIFESLPSRIYKLSQTQIKRIR